MSESFYSYSKAARHLRDRMVQVVSSGTESSLNVAYNTTPIWDPVMHAVLAHRILNEAKGNELHALTRRVLEHPSVLMTTKVDVASYYVARVPREEARWVLPWVKAGTWGSDIQWPLVALHIALCQFGDAKILLRRQNLLDRDFLVRHLHEQAERWRSKGNRRASLFCRHELARRNCLNASWALDECLLLLHQGKIRGAFNLFCRRLQGTADLAPDDCLRLAFVEYVMGRMGMRQIVSNDGALELQQEASRVFKEASGSLSTLRVFSPYAMGLFQRLDGLSLQKTDVVLVEAYAHLLSEEERWGGLTPADILLAGKFMVGAGRGEEALPWMEKRTAQDSQFVDGYATLSVYASSVGLRAWADMCLSLEPMERAHSPGGWFRIALAAAMLGDMSMVADAFRRLHACAPDFFAQWSAGKGSWGVLSLLLHLLGYATASRQAGKLAEKETGWRYRKMLLARFPQGRPVVAMPPFVWPELLPFGACANPTHS